MSIDNYYSPLTVTKKTNDGWGVSEDVVYSGYGFIQPVGGGESFDNYKIDEKVTARMYCPVSLNVVYGDKVSQGGIDYIVLYSFQPLGISQRLHHKEVLLGRYGDAG